MLNLKKVVWTGWFAQADVLINYHASVDTKIDVDTFNVGYGARWNYWGMGYNTQTTTREYEVGTLILDVVDRASNQLFGVELKKVVYKRTSHQKNVLKWSKKLSRIF